MYFMSKSFSVNRNNSHKSEILVKSIKDNDFNIYFSDSKLKMEFYFYRRKQEDQRTYMWKKAEQNLSNSEAWNE